MEQLAEAISLNYEGVCTSWEITTSSQSSLAKQESCATNEKKEHAFQPS